MDRPIVPLRTLILRIGLRFILIVLSLLFITLLLPPLLNLFFPFVLALLVASILAPLVGKFTKKVGKIWSFWSMLFVLLLILGITGLLVFIGYYLFRQISDFYGSWETIQATVNRLITSISEYLEANDIASGTYLEQYALNLVQQIITWITNKVSTWVPNLISSVGNLASGVAIVSPDGSPRSSGPI